jgi:hypothetical protein
MGSRVGATVVVVPRPRSMKTDRIRALLLPLGVLLGIGALLPLVGVFFIIVSMSLAFDAGMGPYGLLLITVALGVVVVLATIAVARGRASGALVLALYGVGVTLLLFSGARTEDVARLAAANGIVSGLALVVAVGIAWPRSLAPRFAAWRGRLAAVSPAWARRHPRLASAAAASALVVVAAGLVVSVERVVHPSCGPGRECVSAAGVSLVLPAGWHPQPRDSEDILFAAAPTHDSPYGLMIRRGSDELDPPTPSDLDGVEAALTAMLDPDRTGSFTRVQDSAVDRVTLPVGPAVRARYAQTTSFIVSYNATVVSYWCFVDGRLLAIQYVANWGEGEAALPADVPSEVRSALDSLRPLRADAAALAGP